MKEIAEQGGNIIYEGSRRSDIPGDISVVRVEIPAVGMATITRLDPVLSQKAYNHSPDGFEWGYSGSGPAQLALALLLDITGDSQLSFRYHQDFKERFVAGWGNTWRINADQVRRWVLLRQYHDEHSEGV
jgi:hypothetical protein